MELSFKMSFSFTSLLGWGSYIVSIAKTAFRKISVLIRFKEICLFSECLKNFTLNTAVLVITRLGWTRP